MKAQALLALATLALVPTVAADPPPVDAWTVANEAYHAVCDQGQAPPEVCERAAAAINSITCIQLRQCSAMVAMTFGFFQSDVAALPNYPSQTTYTAHGGGTNAW